MQSKNFLNHWFEAFEGTPPIGGALRENFSGIWLRIYTLPSAKRYAETQSEEREILRRQNATLTELLGRDGNYQLIVTDYTSSQARHKTHYYLPELEKSMSYLYGVKVDEGIYWHFFVHELLWREGSVDPLLVSIANDERRNVLFVTSDLKKVHHPYDGGADLFIRDHAVKNHLQNKFIAWLSLHPSGL